MKKDNILSGHSSFLHIIKQAFPITTPVLAGYVFLGIAYGITMKENGFGLGWTALCSAFIYGGSMQFAAVNLLSEAFAPLTAVMMTLLIQARHIFYGLSMLQPYGAMQKGRFYAIFGLTDETYSIVVRGAPAGINVSQWYIAVTMLDQSYWIAGSLIGAIAGQIIPFDMTGIDFSMTALFTVIVTEQLVDSVQNWRKGKEKAFDSFFPTALGFGSTLICLILFGSGSFLVAAMIMMLVCFFIDYRLEGSETV